MIDVARLQQRLTDAGRNPGPVDGSLGAKTWAAVFRHFGATDHAEAFGQAAAKHFDAYDLNTGLRLSHFFGQYAVETQGFQRLEENLNYTAQRLCAVWPNRFPTLTIAQKCARNPEALAEEVYGGRMGNDEPGQGYRYRGRGLPHLTGAENYLAAQIRTKLPLLADPDLAADPMNAVLVGCDYWQSKSLNSAADADNLVLVTKRINGGGNGLADRRTMTLKAKGLFC